MRRLAVIACIAAALLGASPAASGETSLAVIVNPSRATALSTDDVARIFLKKRRFWDDGEPIVALNRESGSTEREFFSRRVLGADSARLAAYWNEQYFQGIFPPVTLSSSAAVKRYVAVDRNAIGYIGASEVDSSVRDALRIE